MTRTLKLKLLFVALLLGAAAQGAWAQNYDVWNGTSKSKPWYNSQTGYVVIRTAAELAYVAEHWDDDSGDGVGKDYYEHNMLLEADLDMGVKSWTPFGGAAYKGTFDGNNHTIRIVISGTSNNYQGLFAEIGSDGKVLHLHVTGNINVGGSRKVGGICGENDGHIEDCWVSADIKSSHYSAYSADLGGIAGENDAGFIGWCAMTGNVSNTGGNSGVGGIAGSNNGKDEKVYNVTFYGSVSVNHAQDSKYVGDGKAIFTTDVYDHKNYESELGVGRKTYAKAIRYPYAINLTIEGEGSFQLSAGGETGITSWYPQGVVTLTKQTGQVQSITIKDADGNVIECSGNINDAATFTMPRSDVVVKIVCKDGPTRGAGTEDNPYIIDSADEWDRFVNFVKSGSYNFSGNFVKLTSDISITRMMGESGTNSFQGNFDGDGHTITVNFNTSEPRTAPFRHVKNAVIRNLTVAGTIATSAQFAAGIVSESHGSLSLTGCRSSVAINSSVQGDGTHGGLVSTLSGQGNAINISGCVFDGSFATTNGTTNCGGFIGWPVYNTPTITHSLMAPVSVANGMLINSFARWHSTYIPSITKSYFVAIDNMPADQGKPATVYTTAPRNFGQLEKDYGVMKIYTYGVLFDGKYYLDSGMILPGSGTEEDPYTIGSTEAWDAFVSNIDEGSYYYPGKFVKLTNDISVTKMVKRFQGTFDGDGHTLTVNISENNIFTADIAPFRRIENATIRNLKTAGTVTGTDWAYPLSGIVGRVSGNATIENCSSSAALITDCPARLSAGGIVSSVLPGDGPECTVRIIGCAFTGSITYSNSMGESGAGIVGMISRSRSSSCIPQAYIGHCLSAPSALSIQKIETFNTIAGSESPDFYTITDCYYTEAVGNTQGTKAVILATDPGNLGNLVKDYGMMKVYENGIFFDGKYYVNTCLDLSDNGDNGSAISVFDGATVDVTLTGCTFYKDGSWNTICLPFNLTLAGSPLEGAVARPLTGASVSGTTLNLSFGDAVTELKAGTPYIIKWASGDHLVNPVFNGVTIDATSRSFDNGAKGDDRVRFMGVYKSIAFDGEDKSVLLLGGDNTLYHPISGAGVGALRAYFKIGEGATKASISVEGSVLTIKGE